MNEVLTANEFLDALVAKGIIPELTRHVVIDAQAGDAVRIYVESYGVPALLDVSLEGGAIVVVGAQDT